MKHECISVFFLLLYRRKRERRLPRRAVRRGCVCHGRGRGCRHGPRGSRFDRFLVRLGRHLVAGPTEAVAPSNLCHARPDDAFSPASRAQVRATTHASGPRTGVRALGVLRPRQPRLQRLRRRPLCRVRVARVEADQNDRRGRDGGGVGKGGVHVLGRGGGRGGGCEVEEKEKEGEGG